MRWSTSTLYACLFLAVANAQESRSGCILPQQITGGNFQLVSCTGNSCNLDRGSRVSSGSFLNFTCDKGYILKGNTVSFCYGNEWYLPPTCVKSCPILRSESVDVSCTYHDEIVSCKSGILPGTKATLDCKLAYKIPFADDPGYRELTCLEDGSWDRNLFQCIPECGTVVPHGQTLIVNGFPAEYPTYPWHVGIYRRIGKNENFEQICGGTLVSPDLVISAAHCFWDETIRTIDSAAKFMVAAGKYYRPYNITYLDPFAQKSEIERIDVAPRFFGISGNYAHDIALLRVKTPFTLNTLIKPICMDWDNRHEVEDLQDGKSGKAVGWGRTEVGLPSNFLREVNLPYIPHQNCITTVPEDFRGFVTPDKFCAGYLNGTSLCDGDSGGGLFFQFAGLWFLRGVVSVAPVTRQHMCDNNYYTAFTNVGMFLRWIRTVYFSTSSRPESAPKPKIDFTTVAPNAVPTTSISTSSCILPERPTHGSFELDGCGGPCNVMPGTGAPNGSFLTYKCNEGYAVKGSNVTFCNDNVWSVRSPICLSKLLEGDTVKNCPTLRSKSVDYVCKYIDAIVPCEYPIAPRTVATMVCKNFYKILATKDPRYSEITCLEDGTWDRTAIECIPECGTAVPEGTQLTNGSTINYKYPWRVLIYSKNNSKYSKLHYMGILVSPNIVISRASAFYDEKARRVPNVTFVVAVGKYDHFYSTPEPFAQKSLVRRIDLPEGYIGDSGSFAHNIALLRLETPLNITTLVKPICLDWQNSLQREQFVAGRRDEAAKLNNDTTHVLRNQSHDALPYLPFQKCRPWTARFSKRFITPNTFCRFCSHGPSRQDSRLCSFFEHGDSFACESNGLWYLLGIENLNVSPSSVSCFAMQVYTDIGPYMSWIWDVYVSDG